ncbi:MAG: HD domain-containing protein [Candidatus Omnitrophica bacterium]|nr:HD domain-containing protein [Candidatus Omnitrophota bacterium]
MADLENIESAFRSLLASLQAAKLYGLEHLLFKKSVENVYSSLHNILMEKKELVFGIVEEELAFGKEVFFDLSKSARPEILYLKSKGIERITFYIGMQKEELDNFIRFLVTPRAEIETKTSDHFALLGIKNISIGKLKTDISDKEIKVISLSNLYENSITKVQKTFTNILETETIDSLALRFSINNIMEGLTGKYQGILTLATLKTLDLGMYEHLLNVSILSMYFSSRIGFVKEDVLDIGVAALFHDIGRQYIFRKTTGRPAGPQEGVSALDESHTILGAKLLLRYVDTLGILPIVVAFEHHLKYNLKGTPKLFFPKKPHIASMIVSICDIYDSLFRKRGRKTDYSPDLIYNLMIKGKGESFEPRLIDRFFKIIGVWPIGSIVRLSDGRIAVVRDENEYDIFSPQVEVISPPEKKEFIDLKEKKDIVRIDGYINPLKEGKEFLDTVKVFCT